MLFTTPTEWVALGVTLIAGWLFGLASSSGGKKWKRQLQDSEINAAAYRDQSERELRDANARIRELERERDSAPAAVAESDAKPQEGSQGTSFVPLATAAGVGAVAATLLNRRSEAETEVVTPVEPDAEKSWIPEGPPPPPLAMGAPEPAPQPLPQPIAPDAPAYPGTLAPAQKEVTAAEPDQSFPSTTPAAAPSAVEASAPEAAPPAANPPEPRPAPPVAQSEAQPVQRGHEWLPPHVRAET